ncbi:hypothetical protein G6F37_003565 [Rhizopus arrhizus]|nr:hypothetical protein G6F38_000811 [Rhizopus arrhizus]KAG1160898.1 hypothetical protein G6F37_003565 [Rhizopus arrhizus]
MCLSRFDVGLCVLDLVVQQRALQMRWLVPLLQPSHSPSNPVSVFRASIILPWLAHYVHLNSVPSNSSATEWDYRLPFLFPELCESVPHGPFGALSLLFSAVDNLLQDWSHVVINPMTVLTLPVMALTLAPGPNSSLDFPKSFYKLRGVNCYTVNPNSVTIRPRNWSKFSQFPTLSKKFVTMAADSRISLASFFLRTFHSDDTAALADPPFDRISHISVDAFPFVQALFNLLPTSIYLDRHRSLRCPFDSSYYRRLARSKATNNAIPWKSFGNSLSLIRSAIYGLVCSKIRYRAEKSYTRFSLNVSLMVPVSFVAKLSLLIILYSVAVKNRLYGPQFGIVTSLPLLTLIDSFKQFFILHFLDPFITHHQIPLLSWVRYSLPHGNLTGDMCMIKFLFVLRRWFKLLKI